MRRAAADATQALIGERCRLLAWIGFLVLTYGGTYEFTTMGLRYLDGDLDPALLRSRPTDQNGPAPGRR